MCNMILNKLKIHPKGMANFRKKVHPTGMVMFKKRILNKRLLQTGFKLCTFECQNHLNTSMGIRFIKRKLAMCKQKSGLLSMTMM